MSKRTAKQVLSRLRTLTQGRFVLDSCGVWACELQQQFVAGAVAMIIIDVGKDHSHVTYVPVDKTHWFFDLYA